MLKPTLEILAGVPTIVYGFFAVQLGDAATAARSLSCDVEFFNAAERAASSWGSW